VLVSLLIAVAAAGMQAPPASSRATVVRHVSATVAPAEAALVGTIERFEEAARHLVLQTKDAQHVLFVVAPDAVVRLGSRTLAVADLAAHRGRKANVRYTTADGRRTAHWVVISSDPPRQTY
jgi:hypothetical protein